MKPIASRTAAAVLLIALALAPRVFGQPECTFNGFSCGTSVNGSLDFTTGACLDSNTNRYQLYPITGTAGQTTSITISSATFTTALELINPSNVIVASGSNRIDATFNVTGAWTVEVRNVDVGTGGPYTLTMQCGSAPTPPPAPTGFVLSVNPPSITLPRGGMATIAIATSSVSPFAEPVHVTTSGVPLGVTLDQTTFDFPTPGDGRANAMVAVNDSAPGGQFTIVFTASAADGTVRRTGLSLFIDAPCSPPIFIGQSRSATAVRGLPAVLTLSPSGTPPFSFQWYQGFSGSTVSPEPAPTGKEQILTTPPLFSDEQYWARVSNDCGSADSATILVHVVDPPPRHRATKH